MLSYLHSYHAGNHADILKHLTLFYVLDYFGKKNKTWCFFDTHAGRGKYDLSGEEALKTKEAERGIQKLLKAASNGEDIPIQIEPYISFVKSCLRDAYYPGSPIIESYFSNKDKNHNQLFLCELHKTEFEHLKQSFKTEKNITFFNKSGWEVIKANVPPVVKRGGLLCDPSYEELSDYTEATTLFCSVHKKWNGATLLLWYPLLANKEQEIEDMKQTILKNVKERDFHTEILDACLCVDSNDSHIEKSLKESIGSEKPRLYGSGMFIINPSWGLAEHLYSVLPFLATLLGNDGKGSFSVKML